MYKKNIIRFVHSLVFLPLIIGGVSFNGVMPVGRVISENNDVAEISIKKDAIFADVALSDPELVSKYEDLLQDDASKAEAIDTYFKDREMPLAGVGKKMVEEAKKNNIDWRLLPAIAVRESTGGKFACKRVKFNPFGWGSCKIGFESNEEAIEVVAKNLGGGNPNTAKYYAGKDLREILEAYNPPSIVPKYADQVMDIMNYLGNYNFS